MDKKGVMVEEWKARRKEWRKKEEEKKGKRENVVFGKSPFFFHNQICELLPEYQLAACQPHGLKRERWGQSRYGHMSGRVE